MESYITTDKKTAAALLAAGVPIKETEFSGKICYFHFKKTDFMMEALQEYDQNKMSINVGTVQEAMYVVDKLAKGRKV